MSEKNDDIIVTSAQLGLVDLKPRVTVEITVEEAQKLEIQRLQKLLTQMELDMQDRNELMRAKIYYEQERELHLNLLQDMKDAFEETQFPRVKLTTYSDQAIDRVAKVLEKRNQKQ